MEIWKDIPGYIGSYQVSNFGRIKSLKRTTTKGGILKEYINSRNGYCYVCLSHEGKIMQRRVHVLVALAFLGERKEGIHVNHKDGNKRNNTIDNLEYCSPKENMQHAFATGLQKIRGIKVIDLDSLEVYETATEAARAITKGKGKGEMVARVCRGKRSHYRNHRFAFYEDYVKDTIPVFSGKNPKKASETLWR